MSKRSKVARGQAHARRSIATDSIAQLCCDTPGRGQGGYSWGGYRGIALVCLYTTSMAPSAYIWVYTTSMSIPLDFY